MIRIKTLAQAHKIISHLIYDKAFGIFTRNALDELVKGFEEPFNILFIDFKGVHHLNKVMGYEKVNEVISDIFNEFKFFYPECLIGRWFSGDEIAIIFKPKNDEENIEIADALKTICDDRGIDFEFFILVNQTNLSQIAFISKKRNSDSNDSECNRNR